MREILFRGKRIAGYRDNTENGTMLYGSLFIDKKGQPKIKWYSEHFGVAMTSNVDPNTVGQFTGLLDKNGNKIFEGDILEYRSSFDWGGEEINHVVVFWDEHRWSYETIYSNRWTETWNNKGHKCDIYKGIVKEYGKVIGNIHDNPEFLV